MEEKAHKNTEKHTFNEYYNQGYKRDVKELKYVCVLDDNVGQWDRIRDTGKAQSLPIHHIPSSTFWDYVLLSKNRSK